MSSSHNAPTYVQPVMTEAQLEVLKDLVKAKIVEVGSTSEHLKSYACLLGALLSPPKLQAE